MPLVTTTALRPGAPGSRAPRRDRRRVRPLEGGLIVWTLGLDARADKGIRVNSISPGPTETPMMPDFEAHIGKEFMEDFPIPLGRRSTPEEQAYRWSS